MFLYQFRKRNDENVQVNSKWLHTYCVRFGRAVVYLCHIAFPLFYTFFSFNALLGLCPQIQGDLFKETLLLTCECQQHLCTFKSCIVHHRTIRIICLCSGWNWKQGKLSGNNIWALQQPAQKTNNLLLPLLFAYGRKEI